jgi:F420H(2)-dependent quinone reductase
MSVDKQDASKQQRENIGRALQRFFMQGHVSLYRLTGGTVGGGVPGRAFLILTTIGRKSGAARNTPLFYFPDGGRFIVIASNGGAQKHPTWWLNLQSNPQAKVQIGRNVIPVIAKRAEGEEYERLWSIIATKYTNRSE